MKVVAILPLYPPKSRVGAWLATHELLAGVAGRGHEVDAVTYLAAAPTYVLDGVTVHGQAHQKAVLQDADVVLSHLGDNGHASTHATEHGVPQIRMVHGWADWSRKRLEDAPPAVAVFNSHSLRARVGWDGPSEVIHPPVWPDRFITDTGNRVTQVNLSKEKGADLFWLLSRICPDWGFLGVRGGYGSQVIRSARNVQVLKTTEDMRSVYAQTRILLCPSIEESWGMAGIEAMCSGIPVIATPTAGLCESLGEAGIFVEAGNVKGWQDTIVRLADHAEWYAASARAKQRVAELDPDGEVKKFVTLVENL